MIESIALETRPAAESEPPTVVEWVPALGGLTAGDLMTSPPVAVRPDCTLRQIAETLARHRISAVPVVEESGSVTGIVSESDLIDEERRRIQLPPTLLFGVSPILEEAVRSAYDEGQNLSAADLMTRRVFTLPVETPARAVTEEMVTRRVNHIPITRDGKLVGVVARADVLRALERQWRQADSAVGEGISPAAAGRE